MRGTKKNTLQERRITDITPKLYKDTMSRKAQQRETIDKKARYNQRVAGLPWIRTAETREK